MPSKQPSTANPARMTAPGTATVWIEHSDMPPGRWTVPASATPLLEQLLAMLEELASMTAADTPGFIKKPGRLERLKLPPTPAATDSVSPAPGTPRPASRDD